MKKTILNLFIFFLLLASISACQDEIMNSTPNASDLTTESSVSTLDLSEGLADLIKQHENSFSKKDQMADVYKGLIAKQIEQTRKEPKKDKPKKVIMVPKDYPTFSEAVENAAPDGKIFIMGEISEIGDIIITTPGLTIQGQGSSPKLIGGSIIINTNDVTIQNLSLDKSVTLFNASKTRLMNLSISKSTFTANLRSPLIFYNSSNNLVKNTNLDSKYYGGSYENGVYLDETSNFNVIENTISKNTAQVIVTEDGFAFRIEGSDNTIQNSQALNFTRGFGSIKGLADRNKYIACTASNSTNDAGFVFIQGPGKKVSLLDCTANSNNFGFFILGGDSFISNATAVQNGNLNQVTSGIFILSGKFFIEKSKIQKNRNSGILAVLSSGTLKENNTDSNASGIYLNAVTNSFLIGNTSTMNSFCDYAEDSSLGPVLNVQLSGNNFGTPPCIL